MRWFILLFFIVMATIAFRWLYKTKTASVKSTFKINDTVKSIESNSIELLRLKKHSAEIKDYTAAHHYNTNYCFLADMKLSSGNNRFFVYDLQNDSVVKAGLVAHGYGTGNGIHFSNVAGSNCTSLGKYKIGNLYSGRFGLAYKLYGLDATNSNAFNRFVVLHSHSCVPEKESAPQNICMSQGCPTVSPQFLVSLQGYLKNTQQPVILYIFN